MGTDGGDLRPGGRRLVWITGANGFIGRHVARAADERGTVVAGIGHGAWIETQHAAPKVSYWLNSEITQGSLGQLMAATGKPDSLFHLAGGSSVGVAIVNPYEDFRRTVVSTAGLLEWLRQHAPETRVVAASSAAVYGASHDGPISEIDAISPMSPYGSHKLMMEELCRSYALNYGVRVITPRLFSVYGPGLRKQLFWDLCERIFRGGDIELGGTGEERRDWIHVDDVARALIALADLADVTAPIVNIASGISMSVREAASKVVEAWGLSAPALTVSFNGRARFGDPRSLVANIDRMKSVALTASMPFARGVAEYVHWYRSALEAGT